ncbi:class 1b ribonucleoside-diphosphate reductase subunit alpha [Mollicutes bacterium LVI A0078]|nr:class 1b ribonucleoside-diphosphate reductase subunit alpha [Mollicutes bacterium LVI A0075]WOO90894.1 class 1b ribonucleoside-diphosphate reductase subunit alpha [Mollicutes bacterium LVI A0078]
MKKYIIENNKVTRKNPDGFYNLEADKQAVQLYKEQVSEKIRNFNSRLEKIDYLIENNYYIDFWAMYEREQVETLIEFVYSYEFEFQSYMAISKYYDSYALKSGDKSEFLETYEDRIVCLSLYLAQGDISLATNYAEALITQQYQPATPTFLNAGLKKSGELVSCFLLELDDSLNSINYNLSTAMQLSKIGGGVALNLSKLRARGENVRNVQGVAKGVLPVMKLLEDAFSYVDQLGKRPGAGAAYLSIFHADVIEFLDTKKINADEKSRIQNLSLGLICPDKFFELAKDNQKMALFYPHNVFNEYGQYLDEMDLNEMYEVLLDNPNIRRKYIDSREMLQLIALTQFESGYPYLVFVDNVNRENPLKEIGKIKMSNLCTEIFQIQKVSKINNYGTPDQIGYDISCNLGSLNIVSLMASANFGKTIESSMRALTSVSDLSEIENAPGISKANKKFHSVGLGVMNLHGFLAKNKISYESPQAIEFVDALFMTINYYSLVASNAIATEKGQVFDGFEQSEYKNGNYFDKYSQQFEFEYEQISSLFINIKVPTLEMWNQLKKDVAEKGLYHSYRLAVAPTQSISYIQNATASIQPIVNHIETRVYGNSTTYYPMPYLQPDNVFYYKSAYNMDQMKIIDLVATAQKHVDQGISLVLFVTNQNTTADLAKYYYYSWKKGIKSIYYIRTKNLNIDECESCSI